MEGINVCRGLLQGQQVCAVHDISHQTGVTVGAELPKLCSGSSGGTERVPGNEEQDGSGDGKEDPKHDPSCSMEALSSQQCGLGGDLSSSSVNKSKDNSGNGVTQAGNGGGREAQDDSRVQHGDSQGQDDKDGSDAASSDPKELQTQ